MDGDKLTLKVSFTCGYEPTSDNDALIHAMKCPTCGDI